MHSGRSDEGFARPRLETLESRLLLSDGPIVINEIHYDPDIKTQPAEFVELYNNGATAVDLSGWRFADGIDFTFPSGVTIPAGGYVLVAQNPATVLSKWGRTAYGPYSGQLSNTGERLLLQDRDGVTADQVNYQAGFPWPTVGETPGFSIELINPSMDNDLGGNWRSGTVGSPQSATYIAQSSAWHYFKGAVEPSSPMSQWRQLSFTENASWLSGQGPIGYGESYVTTTLSDMNGKYTTVYLRKTFTVDDPSKVTSLKLEMLIDDGVNVWINGQPVARKNTSSYELACNNTASGSIEDYSWNSFTIANPASLLQAGTNVIAIQVLNSSLSGSTDCVIDARLTATMSSTTGPTPGRRNSDFATNAAPQMRQVEHTPQQPASGQVVTITAKVTDPEGVAEVTLKYQLVNPGSYIAITDYAYQTNWIAVTMHDDGLAGDALAGDGIYTVQMPAALQTNRRLVRYRLSATDSTGLSITAPYADDAQQNFAYYVYDGVPAWSGAIQPGSSDPNKARVVTYGTDVMRSVPAYQLISKQSSVENSNWIDQYTGEQYPYSGTLVYDGVVYDNIHYRARGGMWRYAMGKNMWKINLNRNHPFQARDNYGRLYDTPWDELNLGACIQQADTGRRGEQGMFESVGFRLLQLAGVAAENSSFVQFRVVDSATEAGPTQYDGDFWGMYLAVEQVDGSFLDEHELPDGNIYKMEFGTGTLQNQGPTGVSNGSDLASFINAYTNTTPTEQWWQNELDLEQYYDYRAIVDLIHHYDIGDGKNYFYYSNPDSGQWSVIPWDLDLTWADSMYGSGVEPLKGPVLGNSTFAAEYRARLREIRDLLFNSDQGFALINEYAAMIDGPAGGLSIVDADRAMWDYNPIMTSSYVNPGKSGAGLFYQSAGTKDFPGMVQQMKNYLVTRGAWVDANFAADANITPTPAVLATGPGTYPINQLTFRSSAPTGALPFAAMKWRIGEVSDPAAPAFDPNKPGKYEINAVWESPEITTFTPDITIPSSELQVGHAYRVRVAMKNALGVWSHWSAPIQFIAGATNDAALSPLRLTELMYNSVSGNDDMEFVELLNAGSQPVNAGGANFVSGITYTFPTNTTIPASGRVLLVRFNPATEPAKKQAFLSNYRLGSGSGVTLLGPYTGSLSNGGEAIALNDLAGNRIAEFTYSDNGDWPGRADGLGSSLELINPNLPYAELYAAANWRPSAEFNGTPGSAGVGERRDIQINEVLTHTDPPQSDSVELYNNTDSAINIGGWYLSDSATNYLKYRIPSGTIIPARGYVVFNESDFNPTTASPGANDFSFNGAQGDDVYLVTVDPATGGPGRFVDHVSFGGALNGVSFGRSPNGAGELYPMQRVTLGYGNSYARIGPVVISEVMYHPADLAGGIDDADNEFIELYNPTSSAITLANWFDMNHNSLAESAEKFGWKLDKGVEFVFPVTASIPSHGTIVVAGFNPAIEPDKLSAFRAKYGLGTGVTIVGPWSGKLANSGDSIQLLYPDEPPADEPTFVPYMVVDDTRYSGGASWPASADGGGSSLNRRQWMLLADRASNWSGAAPSPGSASFPAASPAVASSAINAGQVQRSHVSSMSIVFTSDVGASLTAGDLVVHNLATGADIPASAMSLGYNLATRTATWSFPGLTGGTLPDGDYIATLGTADVADSSGNPLDGNRNGLAGDDFTVTFHRLAGDVTGDRAVDVGDLGVLGAHYGQSGPAIPGDMNGDGVVDVGDLGILGANYGSSLAGGAGSLDQLSDQMLMIGEVASASAPVRPALESAGTTTSEQPAPTLLAPQAPTVPTLQPTITSLTIEDGADVPLADAVASQQHTASVLGLDSILDSLDPLAGLSLQLLLA